MGSEGSNVDMEYQRAYCALVVELCAQLLDNDMLKVPLSVVKDIHGVIYDIVSVLTRASAQPARLQAVHVIWTCLQSAVKSNVNRYLRLVGLSAT